MSNGAAGATAGATAAASAAAHRAIKAAGAIVRVEPSDFSKILSKSETPLVVFAEGGIFKTHYRYLTGYKGFVFFTKSNSALQFPGITEIIHSKKIWIPD